MKTNKGKIRALQALRVFVGLMILWGCIMFLNGLYATIWSTYPWYYGLMHMVAGIIVIWINIITKRNVSRTISNMRNDESQN
jgi:hypothetical protein